MTILYGLDVQQSTELTHEVNENHERKQNIMTKVYKSIFKSVTQADGKSVSLPAVGELIGEVQTQLDPSISLAVTSPTEANYQGVNLVIGDVSKGTAMILQRVASYMPPRTVGDRQQGGAWINDVPRTAKIQGEYRFLKDLAPEDEKQGYNMHSVGYHGPVSTTNPVYAADPTRGGVVDIIKDAVVKAVELLAKANVAQPTAAAAAPAEQKAPGKGVEVKA
jgi:hypothetical protein